MVCGDIGSGAAGGWSGRLWRALGVAAGLWVAAAQAPAADSFRVVGGLAGVNQYQRHEVPFWTRDLPRLTGGKVKAEIVPFDQAGLKAEEMLRVLQMGVVPFGTILLSRSAAVEPELGAPDLAGLNPDFASLQKTVAQFRPRLATLLRDKYGLELLAVYTYPAQVIYCAKPFTKLADLAGRKVRVSSATQADFVGALGAVTVQTPFAEVVSSIKAGSVDCAITGTMSGNTIGLHEVTSHVHPIAINWGLAAFVAQGDHWLQLDPAFKRVLERELPQLEQRIWAESERETAEGLACNTGKPDCRSGRPGQMTLVSTTAADERQRVELLDRKVIPAWQRRCGPSCPDPRRREALRAEAPAAR